jgi:hypothetical protein
MRDGRLTLAAVGEDKPRVASKIGESFRAKEKRWPPGGGGRPPQFLGRGGSRTQPYVRKISAEGITHLMIFFHRPDRRPAGRPDFFFLCY